MLALFTGFLGGFKKHIIIGAIALFVIGFIYWKFSSLKSERDVLLTEVSALQTAIDIQDASITNLQDALVTAQEGITKLDKEFKEAEKQNQELIQQLEKDKLDEQIESDPVQAEIIINQRIGDLFDSLKISSQETINENQE